MSIGMKNENGADNKAAARYGYARIGVSTPDGHWTFGLVLHVQPLVGKWFFPMNSLREGSAAKSEELRKTLRAGSSI